MNPKELMEMLAEAADNCDDDGRPCDPEVLKEVFTSFTSKHYAFKPGDLVQWKPGMKNRKGKGPYIVVEVLRVPVINGEHGSDTSLFREPLDIICGEICRCGCGEFKLYHYDSRRFEPYMQTEGSEVKQ